MAKIVVSSTNPVKMNAALLGFQSMFPDETFEIMGVSVPSGVPDQPVGDAQTLEGAQNRVQAARKLGEADYYVGIEGGIAYVGDDVECAAWIVVQDAKGNGGKARTGMFLLPKKIVELLRQGMELGAAADMVFDESNSKQKGGTVGALTGDAIDRTAYYHHAVILALAPFKNPELY
jgi:inosine/xanthosine triphosphatase